MHKFAFLVHLRDYRDDLGGLARPLGWLPESVYRFILNKRPLPPFIWSEVTVTPGATEPEGFIIMLPYSGRQVVEQPKQMLVMIKKAARLASEKGAKIMGLGALTSTVTLGGKLIADNPHISITNGNAYTAVILHSKIVQLIQRFPSCRPVIAIVGATGSVGSLVCMMLARYNPAAQYLLIARNDRRMNKLADEMALDSKNVVVVVSTDMEDAVKADMVVLVTSSPESLIQARHLKPNAIILDATQPRNTSAALHQERPDVTIIDGGLTAITHLKTNTIGRFGLPEGISFACLAETLLLAMDDYQHDFSIGNPTLRQAEEISKLAHKYAHLGFGLAPDHSFGKPLVHSSDSNYHTSDTLL
ncbi:shikimate dehydrogenase [Dyadobacter pollutisoli]|uniref:Shikimate dehydrogenase n=1 Tax=Dyadobacter pollutisoli TaxID=2910158 RepID=A0A9E8SQ96_9BACT|nr:shikimate dehydrogenase [Dyadobacter pollutisoli]WAC12782.1 shikimate dehydrogenase [Dyadobacter pollutisoli]